uniref:Integrin beta n=1 Tax=Magallana gigas TaxID=29159 RepID=K1QAH5_MAGGI
MLMSLCYSLNDPCFGTSLSTKCDKAYSYRHRLKLTPKIEDFEAAVDDIRTTANFDKPEGLFDGLLQTMVCGVSHCHRRKHGETKIGWREKARRMLLYASDINFHQAGDGRLAGILEPNDGTCHLNGEGYYTEAEVQDYPSIGQIIQKAKENNINIIFVIGGNSSELNNQQVRNLFYDKLATLLPGGTPRASELSTDARNILDIVSANYRRLRETVKLVVNEDSEEIQVVMYTNCQTGGRLKDQTNVCSGLTTEKSATFYPYIISTFNTCPEKRNVTFTIFPEGLEERVQVDIDHVCDCDCQLQPEAEPDSEKCSYNGTYECGICNCNPGWIGDQCECDDRGTAEEACGTSNGICNNAGNCTCRKCECFDGYSGDKCECNDKNCRSYERMLCGGPDRGRCDCGKCVCNANYTGEACECAVSTADCQKDNGSCPGTCKNNKDCAECVAFGTGLYNSTAYDRDSGKEVIVKDTRRCPPGSPDPIKIGLSISGAIFLIGLLLLLIWKLLTMLYDSMEYSRFESEIQNPAWERINELVVRKKIEGIILGGCK